MLRKTHFQQPGALLLLLLFNILLGVAGAQTESVVYSFCKKAKCRDGALPWTRLVFDQSGDLFGTTNTGGTHEQQGGVIFKLSPQGTETVLYSFCAKTNCTDGDTPYGAVLFDQNSNQYGSTFYGGAHQNAGVVFKLTPTGKETVLYSFCSLSGCTDGQNPSPVIFDQKGNLYGTTYLGGMNGSGVVFKVTPKGKETVLYSFCALSNCTDGAQPIGSLVFDDKGNVYGTTTIGGASGHGVVFKLTPKGKETVVYSFCSQKNCSDGNLPYDGSLVFDSHGNLYGATNEGGSHGLGVIFKLTPKGTETVLHRFTGSDGQFPTANLTLDRGGNLYGTAFGGALGGGVIFKISSAGQETTLYEFCTQSGCTDGKNPTSGVIFDSSGNLYGTTLRGGTRKDGTVYKLSGLGSSRGAEVAENQR
jgi:uncharacterized repeat protein (TIGR03803 family)